MKKYLVALFFYVTTIICAQYDVSAGMGLHFFSSPDLRDYINSNFSASDDLASFNTSADFFAEIGYNLNDNYQISAELTYNIFSYNSNFSSGVYDLQLAQYKPSIIGYYVINGLNYKFKLGGGLGLRFAEVEEKLYGTTEGYSTTGFGLLLKAQGDTRLGGNFYAIIAGEIRYELPGEINTLTEGTFNLNSFGVGLKLGTVYYF